MRQLAQKQEFNPLEKAAFHRVTELLIPKHQEKDTIVAPLVSSLSRQKGERWLTWITHRKASKHLLSSMGADLNRVRIIHTDKKADNRWLIWEGLSQGNSHTLIADTHILNDTDIEYLEYAAAQGNTSAICIREA